MSERYEIQEKIGQGGIGAVYRAYDTQLKRSVAIKRMLPSEEDDASGLTPEELILKEATTLSALQHPNIITVYDIGIDEEGAFVVMELLKGETLDQVVQRGVLTMKDFTEVVSQTMEALIAAEAAGVLHRDLKPTNVMVNWLPSKKFQVKILDFSLAKFSRTPAPQTIDQGDAIFGSIYFMAPEQFERGNLDKRTDLYSMGCLYYYCLTGQYPFQGESAAQVMASHLQGTVIPLEQIRADLPQVICQWVMWLVNRYADDRPQDSKEAFENFQQLAEAVDPATNRVSLTGVGAVSSLNSTSRRLIVPPPRKTTAVTTIAADGEAADLDTEEGALATGPVGAMPRSENRLLYLWIALGLAALTVVGLGVAALAKKDARDEAIIRLEALADGSPGTAQDIPMIVEFLDSKSIEARTAAKNSLFHLEEENGGKEAINRAIVDALADAKTTIAREAIVDAVDYRGIKSAEKQLVRIAISGEEPRVITKAFHALGAGEIGGDYAFRKILEYFAVGLGSDQSLEKIADRVNRDKATSLVVAKIASQQGKPRYALMRVLGTLGTPEALDALSGILSQDGDREDRLAALKALGEWPERSLAVSSLLKKSIDGKESIYAAEYYASLLLKRGSSPTDRELIDELELLLVNENFDYHDARMTFFEGLAALDDPDLAKATVKKLLQSKKLPEPSRKALRALFPVFAGSETN